jgi:hypothetical protein
MDKKTYEALEEVVKDLRYAYRDGHGIQPFNLKDLEQIENWIDKVAKEYQEEKCPSCGELSDNLGRCKCCNQDAF